MSSNIVKMDRSCHGIQTVDGFQVSVEEKQHNLSLSLVQNQAILLVKQFPAKYLDESVLEVAGN